MMCWEIWREAAIEDFSLRRIGYLEKASFVLEWSRKPYPYNWRKITFIFLIRFHTLVHNPNRCAFHKRKDVDKDV